MMDMVSGWEWLILMAGLVTCIGGGIIYAILHDFRRK